MGSIESRPHISTRNRIAVWAAAAGRCTFCNRLVLQNEDLGELVSIGELAHNVGWSPGSPRGESELSPTERADPENLLLLCRNCHKSTDDGGVMGRYTVDVLQRMKLDHETRIRFLTEIGADRQATIVRMVGPVRGVHPELSYQTVLEATTAAGLFPGVMRDAYEHEVELDLRQQLLDEVSQESLAVAARQIDALAARISDGIRRDEIRQLAVFAMARIPLLVYLGSRLDDKVRTAIFQRQRVDDGNAWRWPTTTATAPEFLLEKLQDGKNVESVALVLNISGTIQLKELPPEIASRNTIFALRPKEPFVPGPAIIDSPGALANFEQTARRFLATVEREHGKLASVALFPAVPVSCAVTMGRILMPNVSPGLLVFDRDESNEFFAALEVRR